MKKTIILIVAGVVIGTCLLLYFVSHIAENYGFINEYQYDGPVNDLIKSIENYTKTTRGISFKITDTTGIAENRIAYYSDINLQENRGDFSFTIECEELSNPDSSKKTDIKLVFACDPTHILGGYNKKAKGVGPIAKIFDADFLAPLEKDQHLSIIPLDQ